MLDFLRRHHKTFWIVVTVVVIISFTFWGASTKTGNRGGASPDDTAVTIYGRDYSNAEVSRLMRFQQLSMRIGMYDFAQTLSMLAQKFSFKDRTPLDFALNLLVLRNEMEKNGVRVTDGEAKEAFRSLPAFQNKDGQFDGVVASAFENDLGSYGFRVEDVLDLMRDSIGLQKLRSLVAGNNVSAPAVANILYASSYQAIKAFSIPFALEDFKKTAQVSDDDIKKYFEQNKDKFQTLPMRAVTYVLLDKPKDIEKLPLDERMKKQSEYGTQVNHFAEETVKDASKFETLAKELKKELHSVPLFAQDSPPAAIKDETILLGDIFSNDPKSHPVSDPIEGKDGYYIYKVTNVQEPKPQELKDVQANIKDILVEQKAQENMMKAASDARKKLADGIKAGRKLEDVAKEAAVQPQPLPEFTRAEPPKALTNGREIAEEAQKTPAGEFTKPLPTEHGVIIIFVQSKTLFKSDQSAMRKQNLEHSLSTFTQNILFHTWFEKRRDEADAKPHLRNNT